VRRLSSTCRTRPASARNEMRLRNNEYCPIHRSRSCFCREQAKKECGWVLVFSVLRTRTTLCFCAENPTTGKCLVFLSGGSVCEEVFVHSCRVCISVGERSTTLAGRPHLRLPTAATSPHSITPHCGKHAFAQSLCTCLRSRLQCLLPVKASGLKTQGCRMAI